MKIYLPILFILLFSFNSCKNRIEKSNTDSLSYDDSILQSLDTALNRISNDTDSYMLIDLPVELKQAFNDWLKVEITNGNILSDGDCPSQGTKEYNKFIENADYYNDGNATIGGKVIPKHRYNVSVNNIRKIIKYDFNNDGILDELIVFDFFDCAASGISYPGDLEASILFLNKNGKFVYDNTSVNKFYKSVNGSDANKYKKDALAYIVIEDIKNGAILGKYESWSSNENAGTNFSQFRGNFSYDISKNSTTISNEEKIKYQ